MRRQWIWGVLFVAGAVVVALVQGGGTASGPAGGSAALPWQSDLPTALARAKSQNRPIMVDFYADWCQWCKRLDQRTFSDANVQKALVGVVTVRLDGEKGGREAAARFGVDGYPTVIFLNAKGVEVGRIPGYMDPGPFLTELHEILNKA